MKQLSVINQQLPNMDKDVRKMTNLTDLTDYKNKAKIGIQKDALPDAIMVAGIVLEKLDFSKPFRAIIDYSPERPKMAIEIYELERREPC